MTDRSKKQEKLKRLREASAKRKRPSSAATPAPQRSGGGRRQSGQRERVPAPTKLGREGLRERLADRVGGHAGGDPQATSRLARRGEAGGQRMQRSGGAGAGGRLAKLMAGRRGKEGRGDATRQSRTDADTRLSEAQRQRVREFIQQRREGGAGGARGQAGARAGRQRGAGRQARETASQPPLQQRYLGQYDEREGEAPQARVKRKLMRADLMKEFADRKREADKAREAQTRQLTKEASKDMGMLFDESRKPTVGSTPEEIEQYHEQLSIRADWLRATLEEIQAELKMLEQIRRAADEQDIDAMIDGEQKPAQKGGAENAKP